MELDLSVCVHVLHWCIVTPEQKPGSVVQDKEGLNIGRQWLAIIRVFLSLIPLRPSLLNPEGTAS
jgi:hypothetical protein